MATISINLDDKASQGLQALNSQLAHTAEVSDHVATATSNLSEQQKHQITIIQKQQASFSTFATSAVPALANTTTAVVKLGTAVLEGGGKLEDFAFKTAGQVVGSLLRMAEMTVKYTLIANGASKVIRAVRGDHEDAGNATDEHRSKLARLAESAGLAGAAYLTLTGQWQSAGQAATTFGAAALKAVVPLGTPLASMGVILAAQNALWARTGITVDETTGQITTNLDRIDQAASRLKGALAAPFVLMTDATLEWLNTPNPLLVAAWKEIDATTTRSASNIVTNLNIVSTALTGVTVDQEKWIEKIEAQREKEKAGFEAIRGVTAKHAQQAAADARAAEVASIKTVAGLEAEERKVRELAGTQATAGRAAADIAKDLDSELSLILRQRTALAQAEDAKQKQMSAERKQWEIAAARETTAGIEREFEERTKAMQTAYEEQQKLVQQFANFERDVRFDAVDETLKTVIAKMKEEGASSADIHHAKLKQLAVETNRRIEAAKTAEEALKAAHEGERNRMRAEAEFHRETEVQKIKDKKDAIKENEKLQKEAAAKLAGDIKGAGGPSGEDLLKATDPRQVAKNIQANRAREAGKKFGDEHGDEYYAADAMGKKRLQAQQRAAMKKAEGEAFRDIKAGKVDPREVATAQNQAAQQTLGAMQKNGALSGDVVKSLSEATRIAAEQQATLGGLQNQVKQIQDFQKKMLGSAQQQRRQSQNGSN